MLTPNPANNALHLWPGLVTSALLLLTIAPAATAQCTGRWLPPDPNSRTDGAINAAIMWDPDGPGPRAPVLVVGGFFSHVGAVAARGIAAYDFEANQWSALGAGLSSGVWALAVLPNGDLVAGGNLTPPVQRWNGSTWSSLGGTNGPNTAVLSLAVAPSGDLIAGGSFTQVDGQPAASIARWNGVAWSPLGAGLPGGGSQQVLALCVLPNGDVIAGGSFTVAGGAPANNIARWDGASWSSLSSGTDGRVQAIAALPDGDLVAGGGFTHAGGAPINYLARWNGLSWSSLGEPNDWVWALATSANGDLFVGGDFSRIAQDAAYVASWNGTSWSRSVDWVGHVRAFAPLADGGMMATLSYSSFTHTDVAEFIPPPMADFNRDGDVGTDADIEAFFACLAGACCPTCPPDADFNGDGDIGTDADIEAFFRVLAGGAC